MALNVKKTPDNWVVLLIKSGSYFWNMILRVVKRIVTLAPLVYTYLLDIDWCMLWLYCDWPKLVVMMCQSLIGYINVYCDVSGFIKWMYIMDCINRTVYIDLN